MKLSIELAKQILDMAKLQAKMLDEYYILKHKAMQTLQPNQVVFFLEQLVTLIEEESTGKYSQNKVQFGNKIYDIALGQQRVSPGLPPWADKLPEPTHVGQNVEVNSNQPSWLGRKGIVEKHFINGDDCGDWGKAYYLVRDSEGIDFTIRAENCNII